MRPLRILMLVFGLLAVVGVAVGIAGGTKVTAGIGTYITMVNGALTALAAIPSVLLPAASKPDAAPADPGAQFDGLSKEVGKRLAAQRSALGADLLRIHLKAADRPEGEVGSIGQRFLQAVPSRLLLLGESGSGKSVCAIQLARDLLAAGAAAAPPWLPLIVKAALWNPEQESFDDWVARSIQEDYQVPGGAARALVDDARILPIVDGLDELSLPLRVMALKRMDAALAPTDRPVVVTSRPGEYDEAVAAGGTPVREALVVRLLPVVPGDLVAYLGREAVDRQWWQPVLDDVEAHPTGVVAEVLRRPLMVWLACRSYPRGGAARPVALLDFTSAGDLQSHLLDRLVDVVLHDRDGRRGSVRWLPFQPSGTRRWLAGLARLTSQQPAGAFAWWELSRMVDRTVLGVVAGLAAGVLFWLALLVSPDAIELGLGAPAGILLGFGFINAYRVQWASGQKELVPGGFRRTPGFLWTLRRAGEALGVTAMAWLVAAALGALAGHGVVSVPTGPGGAWAFPVAAVLALLSGLGAGAIAAALLQRAEELNYRVSTIRAATPR